MKATGKYIHWRIEDQILVLSFLDLDRGNSFGQDIVSEFSAVLKSQKYKAVLFQSSHPRIFCSGGNLSDYNKLSRAKCILANRKIRNFLNTLANLPVPTLALVNGDVFGGGLELLSSFDHVIASPRSLFGFWQRRLALTFGWGGGARLEKRMSTGSLKTWSLSTRALDAYAAQNLNLIQEVVATHRLEERAWQWLRQQIALPQEPLALLKNFDAKKEVSFFEKTWFNPSHKKLLAGFFLNRK